jgi:hypothetical protein
MNYQTPNLDVSWDQLRRTVQEQAELIRSLQVQTKCGCHVIKGKVSEWFWETWDSYVKQPIARKTEELESQAAEQWNKYSDEAQVQMNKPLDYYRKQESFYRGLFWIAVALLLILWIISGS